MSKQWYVHQGNKTHGPFSSSKLKQLANESKVTESAQVANSKDGPWHPITKIKGLGLTKPTPVLAERVATQFTEPPAVAPPQHPAPMG